MEDLIKLIEEKCPGAKPLLISIRGSVAYGTNLPTSDIDYAGIYIQSQDDILSGKYKEQINDDKNDTVFYELRRFMELISSNNPGMLELLNTPEDCLLFKDPLFDIILDKKDDLITKVCAKSFGGYAIGQIKKASGQQKKQNWEKDKTIRKSPIDFCFIHKGEKSIPLTEYLKSNHIDQKFCGLSKIPHAKDMYALFCDYSSQNVFSDIYSYAFDELLFKLFPKKRKFFGLKGIGFENSNDIRLSSIPIDIPSNFFIGHISYNKDGYTTHCNDYKSYTTWLKEKNENRYVATVDEKKYDSKNMMHCVRLLRMAKEIALTKKVNVKRPDFKELIDIRVGNYKYDDLIQGVESSLKEIDLLFSKSDLPNEVSIDINKLILDIRKSFYKRKLVKSNK